VDALTEVDLTRAYAVASSVSTALVSAFFWYQYLSGDPLFSGVSILRCPFWLDVVPVWTCKPFIMVKANFKFLHR
jgi:hypothetical protein